MGELAPTSVFIIPKLVFILQHSVLHTSKYFVTKKKIIFGKPNVFKLLCYDLHVTIFELKSQEPNTFSLLFYYSTFVAWIHIPGLT